MINVHSIFVLYQVLNHSDFINEFNQDEQNIVKWAALLHDVKKRSDPFIEGKDHIHPFNGGMAVLVAFK